jgi:hypothetical protein
MIFKRVDSELSKGYIVQKKTKTVKLDDTTQTNEILT